MEKTGSGKVLKLSSKGLQALKGSIKKWEGICNGTEVDKGFRNCPLCLLFYMKVKVGEGCRGCPVYQKTGYVECNHTPYRTFSGWAGYDVLKEGRCIAGITSRKAAQDELEFLKSLLPKPQMSKEWLKALKGSIRKWEKIVAGKGKDEGQSNCPLCIWAANALREDTVSGRHFCVGCPVHKRTGRQLCLRSPYMRWQKYHKVMGGYSADNFTVFNETSKKLAEAELSFLKSLLPESV